jgi:hypothetical protein
MAIKTVTKRRPKIFRRRDDKMDYRFIVETVEIFDNSAGSEEPFDGHVNFYKQDKFGKYRKKITPETMAEDYYPMSISTLYSKDTKESIDLRRELTKGKL